MLDSHSHTAAGVPPTKKRVFIETWGCQMNIADSETMLASLQGQGYELTHTDTDADLVLLNTCHIREKAKQKVLSRLGVLRGMKEDRPGMRIAVAGCVAQAEGVKLLAAAPQIDVLLGPGKLAALPQLLLDREVSHKSALAVGFAKDREHMHDGETSALVAPPSLSPREKYEPSRYVNIMQGCDNFCTFCVVPFTRGREISRRLGDIVSEVRAMVEQGAKEITLLGQNVNSYGHDLLRDGVLPSTAHDQPFVDLLTQVATIAGLERLRFTTSNPHDFTQSLASLFATQPKLGRYLHLPVQSGHDIVLDRMKRKVTVEEYRERIAWLRAAVPDIALSTDLIVGFPGETDEQFAATLRLVEEVRYSFIFAFKYSPRKGTAAARFPDQIPEAVKEDRLAQLLTLQDRITGEQNAAEVGQMREVLFHYRPRKNPEYVYGRTEHFRLVRVLTNDIQVGETRHVHIVSANKTALVGEVVTPN